MMSKVAAFIKRSQGSPFEPGDVVIHKKNALFAVRRIVRKTHFEAGAWWLEFEDNVGGRSHAQAYKLYGEK